jgi:hypothetical protein
VEHVRRITRTVFDMAQAVESNSRRPRELVTTAYAAEGALDNEHLEWKQRLRDLSLDTDAACDPWAPHASERQQRVAVLDSAEPYLTAIRDLIAEG